MNGRHSDEVTRAWGPTAAAAVVASLPPAAMVSGLGCAGLGLATDSATIAASGAVAATVGIMAQRSASRRLRRRLRQERARNRLELHDLEIRLEQATRHLAEAVALAEAATRAMSGAPLVLTPAGAVVASTMPATSTPVPVPVPAAPAEEPVAVPAAAPVPQPAAEPVHEPAHEPVLEPVAARAASEPTGAPALPRRAAARAAAVARGSADQAHARTNAELAGRVAARLADPAAVFGDTTVPATPAELFTPANGLPVADGDDAGWFSPRRPSGGLPPAPLSPPVGIAVAPAGARPLQLATSATSGALYPPGPRDPMSGAIPLVGAKLPARLADAKVVDLSTLAHPQEPALIVVRRGRHAAAADSVA